MGVATYPTNTNLSNFLQDAGFSSSLVSGLELANGIAAGISEFERRTGRRFLADLDPAGTARAAATLYFDPPVNRERILFLHEQGGFGDLATLTRVDYQPQGASAVTLTQNTDYVIEPQNSDAKGEPWTQIRFLTYRWTMPLATSLRGSILVVGKWGYAVAATGIPEDAWFGMVLLGALYLVEGAGHQLSGGVLSWKEADVSKDYGVAPRERLVKQWSEQAERAVRNYRRLTM